MIAECLSGRWISVALPRSRMLIQTSFQSVCWCVINSFFWKHFLRQRRNNWSNWPLLVWNSNVMLLHSCGYACSPENQTHDHAYGKIKMFCHANIQNERMMSMWYQFSSTDILFTISDRCLSMQSGIVFSMWCCWPTWSISEGFCHFVTALTSLCNAF